MAVAGPREQEGIPALGTPFNSRFVIPTAAPVVEPVGVLIAHAFRPITEKAAHKGRLFSYLAERGTALGWSYLISLGRYSRCTCMFRQEVFVSDGLALYRYIAHS